MMKFLSEESKKDLIEKVLKKDKSLKEIAIENNVARSSLARWVMLYHRNSRAKKKNNRQLSTADRFEHIVATAKLTEIELGTYCRERGLYSFQLQEWKEEFIMQDKGDKKGQQELELKTLRAENKTLRKNSDVLRNDLQRKDKALAEASALLILKKKAALIWGDAEDDYSAASSGSKP